MIPPLCDPSALRIGLRAWVYRPEGIRCRVFSSANRACCSCLAPADVERPVEILLDHSVLLYIDLIDYGSGVYGSPHHR